MTPTYFSLEKKIEYLLGKIKDIDDDYLRSHIANYVCVLLSGLLEAAIREIISACSERTSAPRMSSFVKSRMDGFRNPDIEKITALLSSFDRAITERLESFWDEEIKDAIGSIVGNRHLIAHGRDTTVTYSRVSEWHGCAKKFIHFLEAEFS
ncbi:HEPN domain-containing protein [Bradyrhizobium sp. HKCCYLR1023]|uniref:HEPN domain-containing protein n=1 Tax=Bradyrhizobium TaxID=374 RepID=UPI003EB8D354